MTILDSILKSRDVTLPTKVCLVKAMVFPVVMYGCENWAIKKLSIEEQTGSKLGKEYVKVVSCHPAYLTYM